MKPPLTRSCIVWESFAFTKESSSLSDSDTLSLVGIFLISVGIRQSTDGFLSATKTTQISPNKRYDIVIALMES